jgi:hypothetical protein
VSRRRPASVDALRAGVRAERRVHQYGEVPGLDCLVGPHAPESFSRRIVLLPPVALHHLP